MKVTVTIPDDLYETVTKAAGGTPHVPAHIVKTMEKFGDVLKSSDRYILLRGDDRRAVEAIFRTTVENPADLITKLKRMALFQVGPIERVLDTTELAVLGEQARFHGKSPDDYLKMVVNNVIDQSLGRI